MKKKGKLIEGEDFYFDTRGVMVLTAEWHLKRGKCCGHWCTNCPFDYDEAKKKRPNGKPPIKHKKRDW